MVKRLITWQPGTLDTNRVKTLPQGDTNPGSGRLTTFDIKHWCGLLEVLTGAEFATGGRVPRVVTARPRYFTCEGRKEVVE